MMRSQHETIGIGELGRHTGVSPETIRYYEREGLLPRAGRSAGGHRRYEELHLSRLIFIVRSRDLGFTQPEVRALLALSDRPDAPCDEVQAVASAHLTDIRAKIENLRRMERVLAGMVQRCETEGSPGDCPLVTTLATT
jgi:MerR family transcriptional regulator, mercuric resistance operon regulatory protein